MTYSEQQALLMKYGFEEPHIALWEHPDITKYYLDGNSGDLIIKHSGGWTVDNYYGCIENEHDLMEWLNENLGR